MFISIMLGFTFIYYVVLSFADYVLCVYVLIMAMPYWSRDDPIGDQSLGINRASSFTGLKIMHHWLRNLESLCWLYIL